MSCGSPNIDMAPPECAGLPKRSFRLDGMQWTVCEHRPANRGPALVFYAPGIARRVTCYPTNWQEITPEELYAVSWRR
jgi:hypothetical protein